MLTPVVVSYAEILGVISSSIGMTLFSNPSYTEKNTVHAISVHEIRIVIRFEKYFFICVTLLLLW